MRQQAGKTAIFILVLIFCHFIFFCMKPCAIVFLLVCGIFFIPACKKTDKPVPAATSPTVSALSPDNGSKNTVVTITGTNFGTDISKVAVSFNGMAAVVQTVAGTQITAVVPAKAGTGKVTVTVSGLSADGPVFTYALSYTVTTLAGSGALGHTDGAAASASFGFPVGIAADNKGSLFVADQYYNLVRQVSLASPVTVSTFAGGLQTTAFYADGTGANVKFAYPTALTFDGQGNLIEGDIAGSISIIRKITPAAAVTTLTGLAGGQGNGYADGALNVARFYGPTGTAVDALGNIYVADHENNCIRKITPAGIVSTLAGSPGAGYVDGAGATAKFNGPFTLTLDAQGNLFVADGGNSTIRKITPAGLVSSYCGAGPNSAGTIDGNLSTARFSSPRCVAFDAQGNLYVTDISVHRIRKISTTGAVTTIAGSTQGYADGIGTAAQFNFPNGITVDAQGVIYVSDGNNYRIRKITQE